MIDLETEVPVLLRDFGKKLPTRVAYRTILSWWQDGRWNREAKRLVKLETVRLPVGRCTSIEAYRRFIERLGASAE